MFFYLKEFEQVIVNDFLQYDLIVMINENLYVNRLMDRRNKEKNIY